MALIKKGKWDEIRQDLANISQVDLIGKDGVNIVGDIQ